LRRYTWICLVLRGWFQCFCLEHVRNVMAHAQKPDLVFQQNVLVRLNRREGGGGSSVGYWQSKSSDQRIDHVPTHSTRLLATHSIRIFPLTSPPVRHRVPSGSERPIPGNYSVSKFCQPLHIKLPF